MDKKTSQKNKMAPAFQVSFLLPKYWITWLALLFFYLFSWLPISVMARAGEKLGEYAARKNKKRCNIARVNLSLCFPDKSESEIEALVEAHFRAQMRSLFHYGLVWWAPRWRLKKLINVEGFKKIDEAIEQRKNIILMTCHSAGLEFLGVALAMRYACSGPYKPMRNELINWMVTRGRIRLGTIAYTREEGFRPLIRDTRKGRVLIYLADEDLGSDMSVFAPFFGVEKATISVLGRLVKSCDAVIFPCVGCYDAERSAYRVKVLPAMDEFPTGDELVDVTAMNVAVEELVQECLSQYFWTLRLFQTRPEGEASVYE